MFYTNESHTATVRTYKIFTFDNDLNSVILGEGMARNADVLCEEFAKANGLNPAEVHAKAIKEKSVTVRLFPTND